MSTKACVLYVVVGQGEASSESENAICEDACETDALTLPSD